MNNSTVFRTLLILAAMLVGFTFTACDNEDDTPDPDPMNIAEVATAQGFTTLVAALEQAGLVDAVTDANATLTVFAPTNEAFQTFLDDNGFAALTEVPTDLLRNTLLYHVLGQKVTSSQIEAGYVGTLDNSGPDANTIDMYISTDGGVFLNGSTQVTTPDVEASNGVIHVVDAVINRPSVVGHAASNLLFSELVKAVIKADLAGTLSGEGPFTVLAPTDAAFQALYTALNVSGIDELTKEQLEPILLNHVISGNLREDAVLGATPGDVPTLNAMQAVNLSIVDGKLFVTGDGNTDGGAEVIVTNVQGVNGVVHVVNKVILPL